MRRARASGSLAAGLAALVGLAGCAGVGEPPAGEPAIELGTGSWRFEAVADGDHLPLVRGAQGGWHLWLALRGTHLAAGEAALHLESQIADRTREPIVTDVPVRFDPPNKHGERDFVGYPNILPDPGCLVGAELRVHVTLDVGGEAPLEDERVVVVDPGDDPPEACEPP